MDRGARKQNPQKNNTPTGRIGADPCDTEHRLETSPGAGESRETNTESRTCGMRGHVPRKKKELREAKRRSAEKNIKSKSISMEK